MARHPDELPLLAWAKAADLTEPARRLLRASGIATLGEFRAQLPGLRLRGLGPAFRRYLAEAAGVEWPVRA